MNERNQHILRITNANDVITKIPFIGYVEVGYEIMFTRTSASSDKYGKIRTDHNLKNYISELFAYKIPKKK